MARRRNKQPDSNATQRSDAVAVVSARGAARWQRGHPWIFRSDVREIPGAPAGAVRVLDDRRRPLGIALWSPVSEISLRLLDSDPDVTLDDAWWFQRLRQAVERRTPLAGTTNACRLVHGEGDAIPSLVCDRYDRWLVVQINSAGLEPFRSSILAALLALVQPLGVLARNDATARAREGLPRETTLEYGDVPREIEVNEHDVRYLAAPWTGQKTGAFLDQRENRLRVREVASGRALDCFAYHGSFALHMAMAAGQVVALDSSADALARARNNASLNSTENIDFVEADAFDYLRERERAGERFDTIVLDPPAFAKTRATLPTALNGYHEINLRAMRLLATGGLLFTASCSYHLNKPHFLGMLEDAARDSGRRMVLRELRGQPLDHPEVLTIPETGYLKGALLEAAD
ncbi:MAG: Ribosomal RNA large subunit methyltransferase I [Gemmatimonadaceae bacterium]|nr:Ribosomal RNA large subunit methyltransferase I [Gemmatimonadaceae bacterium]